MRIDAISPMVMRSKAGKSGSIKKTSDVLSVIKSVSCGIVAPIASAPLIGAATALGVLHISQIAGFGNSKNDDNDNDNEGNT